MADFSDAELVRHLLDQAGELLAMSGDMPGPYEGANARMDPEDPRSVLLELFPPDHSQECEKNPDPDPDRECGCDETQKSRKLRLLVEEDKPPTGRAVWLDDKTYSIHPNR